MYRAGDDILGFRLVTEDPGLLGPSGGIRGSWESFGTFIIWDIYRVNTVLVREMKRRAKGFLVPEMLQRRIRETSMT